MNQKKNEIFHQPALLKETIDCLNIKPGEIYIDATIGSGGHAIEILKKGGKVFGIDCDPEAVKFAKKHLQKACSAPNQELRGHLAASFKIIKANFANLKQILQKNKITNPAGILFDLGTSLHQLKTKRRGFSFAIDEPLDMRMDPDLKVTAADLINGLGKRELYELFSRLGEEKFALPISKTIVLVRRREPIKNTKQLADLIVKIYKKRKVRTKIHPATKVFQALRICVNDELNNLKQALPQALEVLKKGGRLVVISFHGLEDRIVKNFLKEEEKKERLKILTKKPIVPTWEEKISNPRCRSAKLRCGEKK